MLLLFKMFIGSKRHFTFYILNGKLIRIRKKKQLKLNIFWIVASAEHSMTKKIEKPLNLICFLLQRVEDISGSGRDSWHQKVCR
jgi:hypothetical protein